jgi:hypothetical protein
MMSVVVTMPMTRSSSSTIGRACTPDSMIRLAASSRLVSGRRLVTDVRMICPLLNRASRKAAQSVAPRGAKYSTFIRSAELSIPTRRLSRTTGR